MPKDYNDADVKFMQMMIPHHEKAVIMAHKVLSSGENAAVATLAKSISSAQIREIVIMERWLKERGIAVSASMPGM